MWQLGRDYSTKKTVIYPALCRCDLMLCLSGLAALQLAYCLCSLYDIIKNWLKITSLRLRAVDLRCGRR